MLRRYNILSCNCASRAFRSFRRNLGFVILLQLFFFLGAPLALAQSAPEIPWNNSLTITRTSQDEDIKTVLRSLLQANGMSVIFGPGVEGAVSFRLDKVAIHSVFDQLVEEHNLSSTYDPVTNTASQVAERTTMLLTPARPFPLAR